MNQLLLWIISIYELHSTIQKNWQNNIIPNVILSSATLPKQHEIGGAIANFRSKFPDSIIENIVSHDCKKTIPIINKEGYMVLPHMMFLNSKIWQKVLIIVNRTRHFFGIWISRLFCDL